MADGLVWLMVIVGGIVNLLLLYVVVRYGVEHGQRAHDVWRAEGGLERTLDARVTKREQRAAINRLDKSS